jgi:hypothetical protein
MTPTSLDQNMQSKGPVKHFILAFMLALVGYAAFYQGIEHWRARKGPWRVTFTHRSAHAPVMTIDQPGLAITNVQIVFVGENLPAPRKPGVFPADPTRPNSPITDHASPSTTLRFAQPHSVPYDVPFGRCVFLDLMSLPGTVAFELFGHEIQLLPRVLIVDRQEYPWRPDATITLSPAPALQNGAQPRPQ